MMMDFEHTPAPGALFQGERRSYQCECGSQIFYKEVKEDKIYCAMPRCHKVIANKIQRAEDEKILTYPELVRIWNGK
jgi:DNA-directed RNA polymerase subunit RPC12/RpoP